MNTDGVVPIREGSDMPEDTDDTRLITILLIVIGAIIILPMGFGMMGFGSMMGGMWGGGMGVMEQYRDGCSSSGS